MHPHRCSEPDTLGVLTTRGPNRAAARGRAGAIASPARPPARQTRSPQDRTGSRTWSSEICTVSVARRGRCRRPSRRPPCARRRPPSPGPARSRADLHPLDRNGLGGHDGTLGVQRDLVLLLGDGRAVVGVAAVGVGDGLALEGDLLVRHRHRDLLGLGDDALAQPRAAGLTGLGADAELLLGAGHGAVGRRAGRVAPDRGLLATLETPSGRSFRSVVPVRSIRSAPPCRRRCRRRCHRCPGGSSCRAALLVGERWPSWSTLGASFTIALS